MQFALLGDHAEGLEMARALAETGRHELAIYSGPALGAEILQRWDIKTTRQGDLEEVLADPAIELLIVAGPTSQRPAQLRRALQSERHVLCVHPADDSPDIAYEAAMLQGDTGRLLLPLLPEALHPAVRRLAEVTHGAVPRLIECERWSTDDVLLDADNIAHRPGLPGWDTLRLVGGEIGELLALSSTEDLAGHQPMLLSGRFMSGGLFQATYLPDQAESRWRLTVLGATGRAELLFPHGWPGAARLTYVDEQGQEKLEEWPAQNPWTPMVETFEESLRRLPTPAKQQKTRANATDTLTQNRLGWLDAIRALELDDATRRSLARRRASTLEFQEVTEEAGFKGTMTLVGCSILWASLLLVILSRWVPWLGWLIAPVIGIFLVLQLLRWVMPDKATEQQEE